MLRTSTGNFANEDVHLLHAGHGKVGNVASFGIELSAIVGKGTNLLGGVMAHTCQLLHLFGHHSKSFASVASTGSLNGGVEREDVGLAGNFVD